MKTGHADKARELFNEGYNCSQAVLGAFAEDAGLDVKTALRLSAPFGGGMGRMREVCGAVSGMTFVMSALYGYDDPKAFEEKADLYKKIQTVANEFKNENGSIVCRERLALQTTGASAPTPEHRTDAYYKKRPCPELVKQAADFIEDFIAKNPISK